MPQRALAVLVTVLLLVGGSAGAAGARELVLRDGSGDMWRLGLSSSQATRAPHTRHGDVRRIAFRHGPRNIVVTARYAVLRRSGSYGAFTVRLATKRHVYREVRVETSPGARRGELRVFGGRGRLVHCPRARHRIDYRRDTVRIVVPRACLGTPRYVHAAAANYWASYQHRLVTDNPHNARAHVRGWTRWIRTR